MNILIIWYCFMKMEATIVFNTHTHTHTEIMIYSSTKMDEIALHIFIKIYIFHTPLLHPPTACTLQLKT